MHTSGGPDMDLEELGLTTTRSTASLSDARENQLDTLTSLVSPPSYSKWPPGCRMKVPFELHTTLTCRDNVITYSHTCIN